MVLEEQFANELLWRLMDATGCDLAEMGLAVTDHDLRRSVRLTCQDTCMPNPSKCPVFRQVCPTSRQPRRH